jgi:glycosyltransferase involved in cell wall biosynthesis
MKNITLITTGQPSTNPRLIKEADFLCSLGYNVKVIYCFYQPWAQQLDKSIISKNPGMYICRGGDPVKSKFTYYKTRLRQKLCQLLFSYFKGWGIPENAISRTHSEALSAAKKIKTDLYIAHNLGALPAAVKAANYMGCKVGYDAEDMHSAQFNNVSMMYLLNKYIEVKYFNRTDYFTAASPLIADNYRQTYPGLQPLVINNVFPKVNTPFNENYHTGDNVKLFWFSQTIGADRGLENIVAAMAEAPKTELHLLGSCTAEYKSTLLDVAIKNQVQPNRIIFHPPIPSDELMAFAAQFDIGMASETGSTLNREICLTNKIFTYLQSGLAIIASDTQAQRLFLSEYSWAGKLYQKNNTKSLAGCLNEYLQNPEALHQTRLGNYQLGQTDLNWETESHKFEDIISSTLGN